MALNSHPRKVIDHEFQIGDVVCLLSGGPAMTAYLIDNDGDVYTQWFDDKDHVQSDTFNPKVLKRHRDFC